jgi:hypothetical protein
MTLVLADIVEDLSLAVGIIAVIVAIATAFVRFRPKFEARIDGNRQAILLNVRNKGRLDGRVNAVSVLASDGRLAIPNIVFPGLSDGKFHSGQISHKQSRSLVINAEKENPFPDSIKVFVKWGSGRSRLITPKLMPEISYYGTESNWPAKD